MGSTTKPPRDRLVRRAHPGELEQYEQDLERLAELAAGALADLERIEGLDRWEPTAYEQYYLPGLRLAGLSQKQGVTLQNVADLHVHTHFSDGDDLEKVLEAAIAQRLDVLAITDHDEIEGALLARRLVHERGLHLAVVPGVEVSSAEGHIGALFVTRPIPAGLSAHETVAAIHAAGGLAVAHHPFAPPIIEALLRVRLSCRELVHEVAFDAIECTNAVPGYGRRYNIAACDALEQRRVRIGRTGSSDAHVARFVGKGRTYFGGNEGVRSLNVALAHGFVQGAEGYWRFSEKLVYRWKLVQGIARNLLRKRQSVH